MPNEPTICAAIFVACTRSPDGPVPDSPKNSSSALMPPNAIFIMPSSSERVRVKRSSVSVCASRPSASLALDDRQHFELAVLPDEVRDGRVPRLVGRDRALLFFGVFDRLLQTDLLGHLRLLDVGPLHRRAPVAQRPHERLVEEVLDHHRRVPEGHCRELVASLFLVELGDVRLLVEVVVDDLAPTRPRLGTSKWIERSNRPGRSSAGSRSAARFVAAITKMFDGAGGCFLMRRCVGQAAVRPVDQPAREACGRAVGVVERLQLDQQLVDDARDAFARVRSTTCRPYGSLLKTLGHAGVRAHAAAGAGDRVDLFDEADRATLFARGLAQLLEVVADLAAGRAVVLRLERGRRHEQERHAGLARHRLRHVRLAGAGRTFEQDALARVATHHFDGRSGTRGTG